MPINIYNVHSAHSTNKTVFKYRQKYKNLDLFHIDGVWWRKSIDTILRKAWTYDHQKKLSAMNRHKKKQQHEGKINNKTILIVF